MTGSDDRVRVPVEPGDSDAQVAYHLAHGAGQLLLRLRAEAAENHGPDRTAGSRGIDEVAGAHSLRDRGDRASQEHLQAALDRLAPGDAVLSEEAADDRARLDATRVWIIDPLDGTREYAEGRSDWAVHVALWSHGELRTGAVSLPALGLTFANDPAPTLPRRSDERVRVMVSRTRPPEQAELVRAALDGELVPMGSAGAKVMAVLRGEGDVYVHAGGQYEWDSAAPVVIALAAGLHASRLDGSPLVYNRSDPWQPELLVARPEFAAPALAALRAAMSS